MSLFLVDIYTQALVQKNKGSRLQYILVPTYAEIIDILKTTYPERFADFKEKHLAYLLNQRSDENDKWKPILFKRWINRNS